MSTTLEDSLVEAFAGRAEEIMPRRGLFHDAFVAHQRRRARRRGVAIAGLAAVGAAVGVTAPGVATGSRPRSDVANPNRSLQVRLTAALTSDKADIEETVSTANGFEEQMWFDPMTSKLVERFFDPDGKLTYVSALTGPTVGTQQDTEINYATRQWWTDSVSDVRATTVGSQPGPTLPTQQILSAIEREQNVSPDQMSTAIRSGTLTLIGHAMVDGQETLHVRLQDGSQSGVPGSTLDVWINDDTNQVVRTSTLLGPGRIQQMDYHWLSATPKTLAVFDVTAPAGFTQLSGPPDTKAP